MNDLYLGTQGWSYPSWVGPFYPAGTSSKAFLEHYATAFDTVELDTTFYAVPRASTIAGWKNRTPDSFRFAAKFPQRITHEKKLVDCGQEAASFIEAMTGLEEKLGALLLQMPPAWSSGGYEALASFLPTLPAGFRYAIEVRHRSWLAAAMLPRLLGLLHQHSVALCLVQHAWMPVLDEVTAPFVYIRWLGRREDIPDDDFSHVRLNRDAQLESWAGRIKGYLQSGLIVFGYANNHYQGYSPATVRSLQMKLGALLTPDDESP